MAVVGRAYAGAPSRCKAKALAGIATPEK